MSGRDTPNRGGLRPLRSTSSDPDVVVIGGGVIGISAAYELARRGARVVLLERELKVGSSGSVGGAGLLVPSHAAPLATARNLRQGLRWMVKQESPLKVRLRPSLLPWLARFAVSSMAGHQRERTELTRILCIGSLDMHLALANAGLETGLRRRGVLNVYETETSFAAGEEEAREHVAAGMRVQILNAAEATELEPALRACAGAIYFPDEAHADPGKFVAAVAQAATDAGASIRLAAEAIGFTARKGVVERVETREGSLRAGTFVLAAGAWSRILARDLSLFLPVEGGKGYNLEFEAEEHDQRIPLFLQDARIVATPLPGRVRLAGTLDLCGLDMGVDERRLAAIERAGRIALRWDDSRRVVSSWRGLRPCTPDGLPIVGRTEKFRNLVVATGHAMLGFTLAPITGRIVADLVTGTASWEIAALAPERFRRIAVPFGKRSDDR